MIFFDNASTTKICKASLDEVVKYSEDEFYNPSALYHESMVISEQINSARKEIIKFLGGTSADKFIFTSGATEANNTIIRSNARNKNAKMLFSLGEHPSVYNVAIDLQNQGYNVDFIKLNSDGCVDVGDLQRKLDTNTCFVSFMHVSNETGAINDVKKLTQLVKSKSKALVHVDGVQAFMKLPVNVSNLGVDYYTISAHKFHGPKGVGGFYMKQGVNVKPFLIGGGQENNLRSGTENVPAIMGMLAAIKDGYADISANYLRLTEMSVFLCDAVNKFGYALNITNHSPYINALSFEGVRAETILHMLEQKGYLVGNGSACSSKHRDNRVLGSIGLSNDEIEGSIRVSFSKINSFDEVTSFVKDLQECVEEYKQKTNGRKN